MVKKSPPAIIFPLNSIRALILLLLLSSPEPTGNQFCACVIELKSSKKEMNKVNEQEDKFFMWLF
jgi:hypothetical protein